MNDWLLGIDIGTQGSKAGLYAAGGRCLAEAFEASQPSRPGPGMLEEDPENQVAAVCRTIRGCMERAAAAGEHGTVAALAIDGQMAGILGIGSDGRCVTPYDSWLDTRCGPWIERMQAQAGHAVLEKTGNVPSFNHGPKILWWKHERPDVCAAVARWVQPGGYAAMRLCGLSAEEAFLDHTYLHFSGFADNRRAVWDEELCAEFEIDARQLPRIVAPQEIVGRLTAPMAEACGLPPGTPVAAGCGDTAASFLSCGATREGICVDVAGTASVFAATTSKFVADHEHRMLGCGRSVTPGLWHPYAYINGGGMNLEWFRRELGSAGEGEALSLESLAELAAAVEPADDLPFFVPHLGGRVSPGWPRLRGAWAGLTWDHGTGALYRAVLEGVALEYGLYREVLLRLAPLTECMELRVTGGGEQSALWNRIKADALQTRLVRIERGGGAPMGAALLAGWAAGVHDDVAMAAESWVQLGQATEPDRALAGLYWRRTVRYAELLDCLQSWAEDRRRL